MFGQKLVDEGHSSNKAARKFKMAMQEIKKKHHEYGEEVIHKEVIHKEGSSSLDEADSKSLQRLWWSSETLLRNYWATLA